MEKSRAPNSYGKCNHCNGILRPLLSKSQPSSSELYCDTCHKSYGMTEDDYIMFTTKGKV